MFITPIDKKATIIFGQNFATNPKTKLYPDDSVELSGAAAGVKNGVNNNEETEKKDKTKEKQKNNLKNSLIAASTGLVTLCAISLLYARNQKNKILKLYKEKMTLSNLPVKLNFKEFKTIDEAIKYAKETLGIKHIDSGFSLEALNTAIKGLIDVSNANRGKIFMPKRLGFEPPGENHKNFLAYVVGDIHSSRFGDLVINKDYFDEAILNKELDKALFYKDGEKIYEIDDITHDVQSFWKLGCVYPFPKEELHELIQKYYKDKASLNIKDKQKLFYSLDYGEMIAENYARNPLDVLKIISKEKVDFLQRNNINLDFNELSKMKTEEQTKYLKDLVEKIEDNGSYVAIWYGLESPSCIIHHEMGHLQDYAKNLKDLDVMKYKFSFKQTWNDIKHNIKSRINVDEVDNRWGCVWQKKYSDLMKENPKKFKKLYPDLNEFLTNPEIQQTAGKISSYAQSGIGEFIAETYARMIAGRPIPEDVTALYKKYKGPELPL